MGLPAPVAEMLFCENQFKSINGEVGFIGRQTTYLRQNSLNHLAIKYSLSIPTDFSIEYDSSTRSNSFLGGHFITDRSLMKYLGAKSYKAIDVSDYEGADIVCDLSRDIPRNLHNSFDFIFDGSCLDNIFNPASALMNISRLLKPSGRVVLMNHATWMNNPYSIFSPSWFFDYFAANAYDDCQIFLGVFTNNQDLHLGPMSLYFYNWSPVRDGAIPPLAVGTQILLIVFAEKGSGSTNEVSPVQRQYRDKQTEDLFQLNAHRIQRSPRRLFSLQYDLWNNPAEYIPLVTLGNDLPS